MRKKLRASETFLEEGISASSPRGSRDYSSTSEDDDNDDDFEEDFQSDQNEEPKKRSPRSRRRRRRRRGSGGNGSGVLVPVALGVAVAALVFWREIISYDAATRTCSFPRPTSATASVLRMAVLADARVVDAGPTRHLTGALAEFRGDLHLRKLYRRLHAEHGPDAVVFLGDLLDVGRRTADDADPRSPAWSRLVARWQATFADSSAAASRRPGKDFVLVAACGERDVGSTAADVPRRAARFAESFGELHAVSRAKDFDLVRICAPAIVHGDPKQRSLAAKVLAGLNKSLAAALATKKPALKPRILLTHVPLWKSELSGCPVSSLLNASLSSDLLARVSPVAVFSSGGSRACVSQHLSGKVTEHSIAKVSISGAGYSSSYALVTLQLDPETKATSVEVSTCSMPSHVLTIGLYGVAGFLASIYAFFHSASQPKKKNMATSTLTSALSLIALVLVVFTAAQVLCALIEWTDDH